MITVAISAHGITTVAAVAIVLQSRVVDTEVARDRARFSGSYRGLPNLGVLIPCWTVIASAPEAALLAGVG